MAYLNKNQGDLAPVLGVTRQSVSRKLRGETSISIDELAKIALALDVSISDLLGDAAVAS